MYLANYHCAKLLIEIHTGALELVHKNPAVPTVANLDVVQYAAIGDNVG